MLCHACRRYASPEWDHRRESGPTRWTLCPRCGALLAPHATPDPTSPVWRDDARITPERAAGVPG